MLLPPWDDYALLPGPHKTAVACLSPGSARRDRSGSQGRPIVEVHYAKAYPDDLLMAISVTNAGPDADMLHVLPTWEAWP